MTDGGREGGTGNGPVCLSASVAFSFFMLPPFLPPSVFFLFICWWLAGWLAGWLHLVSHILPSVLSPLKLPATDCIAPPLRTLPYPLAATHSNA